MITFPLKEAESATINFSDTSVSDTIEPNRHGLLSHFPFTRLHLYFKLVTLKTPNTDAEKVHFRNLPDSEGWRRFLTLNCWVIIADA